MSALPTHSVYRLAAPRDRQGVVMRTWYPGWQVAAAWLLTVAVAAVIYFVPVTRIVDSLSDQSTAVTADAQ